MQRVRRLALSFALAAMASGASAVQASTLWYNGDFDGNDAVENATNLASTLNGGTLYSAFVYDDFIVPVGQTWTITNLFSNIQQVSGLSGPSTSATWQIRTGISTGNGGTLVASGDGAATMTATGGATIAPTLAAFVVSENISALTLTAGTYWLTVAPDIVSPFYFANGDYISTTSGANAIGMPPGNGSSFINTVGLPAGVGYNYAPTSVIEGPGNWDFSMGVNGTITLTPVPEPSSLTLAGVALCVGGITLARRRLKVRTSLFAREG
jgi:hypothetical protein